DALLEGGGRSILLPDRLQLDAGVDLDLVAGDAELRLLGHGGLNGLLVDPGVAGPVRLVGAHQDLVSLCVADGLEDARGVEGAEHRLVDVARRDPPGAVALVVGLADAVAGDAGDAFLGSAAAVPPRDVAPLAEGRADGGVTANTEGVDRAARQV